ncbi:MAG: DEAD/DEAH box helicase, partial [Candidatus Bathyarchaeia archaeon]
MSNSASLAHYWNIVEAIVKSRGRTPQRYHYFEDIWESLQNNKIIFLQAPTGAGKTEAVLTPFIQDLIDGERRWHSLLYVLPTRSLVYNMFYRICKTLDTCRQTFGMPKIVVDYDYGGFTPFKAFLEGDVTITTYDTLFYTFYGFRSYGHHFLLSVGKIAGSLVIFDETQLLQDSEWYSLTLL